MSDTITLPAELNRAQIEAVAHLLDCEGATITRTHAALIAESVWEAIKQNAGRA